MLRARVALWFCCALWVVTADSAPFAVRISPPNFELKAKPGGLVRQVVHIQNGADETANYVVRTADCDLSDGGGVVIRPAEEGLADDSCRPWTGIERQSLQLAPQQIKKYRFEVEVPGGRLTANAGLPY